MPPSAPGWDDILDSDESILWQGRPDGVIVWRDALSFQSAFGVFFTGFALAWLTMLRAMTAQASNTPFAMQAIFELIGWLFVGIGLYTVVGRLPMDAWRRRRTWYTLTTKAAYIATDLAGRRGLKRYDVARMTDPALHDDSPGSVFFAEEIKTFTSRRRGGAQRTRTQRVPIGFVRIDDARRVFRLINEQRPTSPAG